MNDGNTRQDIILINPDSVTFARNTNFGLASLESYLNHNGIRCITIKEWELDNYINRSEVFGLSVLDHTYLPSQELTQRLEDKTVVWGGWTATALPEFILKENPSVNYVVLGEGERRLVQLVESLRDPGKFRRIDGIAYRDDHNRIVVRPPKGFLNMNELVVPGDGAVSEKLVFVELSRGCYGKCSYCQEVGRMRFKSAKKAADEIEYWHGKGYRYFYVGNANSIANGRLLFEFIRELEQRNLNVELELVGRPDDVLRNTDVLEQVFKSRIVRLFAIEMGIEANTRHALNLLGRGTTPEVNRDAMDAVIGLIKKYSPSTDIHANIILFPHFDMTLEDFVENIRFMGDYRYSRKTLAPYLFGYANTPIWHEMKARGFRTQKEFGMRITGYRFSNEDVDRLFRKLVWLPLKELVREQPAFNSAEATSRLHDRAMAFYNSGDIKGFISDFLNS